MPCSCSSAPASCCGSVGPWPNSSGPSPPVERVAFGVLVGALEEGLVTTLQHAMDVLKRFSAPAEPSSEQWIREQEKKLRMSPDARALLDGRDAPQLEPALGW